MVFIGCKAVGKKLASGAIIGVKEQRTAEYVEGMVENIVANSRDQLLGDTTAQKIDSLLDKVMYRLRTGVDSMTTSVRDSLLNEYTSLKIKKIILEAGEGLNVTLAQARENLLGSRTKVLIGQIRDELLGDSTLLSIAAIRDELLGDATKQRIDSLLKSSITTISTGFENEIKPQIEATLQSAGRTVEDTIDAVTWALIGLILVLVGAVAFIWRKFSTRKRIMKILTQEIDKIKSQEQYDELVAEIRKRTLNENLEQSFQKILKQDNLYQQEEWIDKDKRLLNELASVLDAKLSKDDLSRISQVIAEKGLQSHFDSVRRKKG